MSDAVTRARELLAAATPGPWWLLNEYTEPWEEGDEWHVYGRVGNRIPRVVDNSEDQLTWSDAELIAAAPTLLAELANEVETAWRAYHAVADEVEVLHRRRIVSEGMVRRAAKAYDDAVVDGLWTRQDLIRAALEAALGVES